jgi:hypothetical protein
MAAGNHMGHGGRFLLLVVLLPWLALGLWWEPSTAS